MASKTYTGYREHTATGGVAGTTVTVHEDGQAPRPLDLRLDLHSHSPTGLEWGYLGSGPAQLALALTADALGDDERAQDIYQDFKFKVVGRLAGDGWTLTDAQVRAAVETLEERGRGRE